MNGRISKLIRKSITASTELQGDKLNHAIRTAKRAYNDTPRPYRSAIKLVLKGNI